MSDDCSTPELEIIHRDERLLVVCKPAGMIVHRGWGEDPVTVADLVRDQIVVWRCMLTTCKLRILMEGNWTDAPIFLPTWQSR